MRYPNTSIIASKRNSGKSVLIKDICYEAVKSGNINLIFVFSTTIFNGDYEYCPKEYQFEEFSEEKIKQIMDFQEKAIKQYGNKNDPQVKKVLIVLDDVVGSGIEKSPIIKALFTRSRHYNISLILATQQLKSITAPVVRQNADYFFFSQLNYDNMKTCYSDFCYSSLPFNDWKKQMIKSLDEKPFSFICFNSFETRPEKRYLRVVARFPLNFTLKF